jgi:hypothetical protein
MNCFQFQGGAKMQENRTKYLVRAFLLVAVVAVLAAAPASAQVSFNVTSSAQTVRTEGQTETAGSVNMTLASGAGGTITAGSSITLTYATATVLANSPYVTAKIGGTACVPAQQGTVAATGNCGNMSVATSGSSVIISFTGITPSAAATFLVAGDFIQVAEARLNIAAVTGAQPVSGTTPLLATISGNSPSANTITFNQNQVQVATISSSLNISKGAAAAIQTCSVATQAFTVTVAEIFPAAITSAGDEGSFTPHSPLLATLNGTSVNFVFTNVPPGVTITPTPTAAAFITGGSNISTAAVPAAQTSASAATPLIFTVLVTTTASGPSVVDKPVFNFSFGAATTSITPLANNSLPSPTSAQVQVYLGPVTNTATTVVRFTQLNYPAAPLTVGTFNDCSTNLLFPYHNASNGFDTSYAFANTTSDALVFGAPGAAKPVNGTCKLTLFTSDLAGNSTGTATLTTPTIPTAGVVAFSSASGGGGVASNTALNGQAGYVIAVCNFLDAHGYALVTNGNASVVPTGQQYATGYLGLVMTNILGGPTYSLRGQNEAFGH